MGDRANVFVKESGVNLYTHWGGSELPMKVRDALAKKWRWDDPVYLTRIIFCEMVKGHEREETGFGISTEAPDNEHPIITVSTDAQTVSFEDESGLGHEWPFSSYVKLRDSALRRAYEESDNQ